MSNRIYQRILLAAIGAFVGAIVTVISAKILSGNINYLLVGILLITAILIAVLVYGLYRRYFSFPFMKWYIEREYKDPNENKNAYKLKSDNPAINGIRVDKAWEFKANANNWAVIGPYIYLTEGKFRAIFSVKVDNISGTERIIEIDIASRCKEKGDRKLAVRTLTTRDFVYGANKYHEFFLDFYIFSSEPDLEFRINSFDGGHTVTVHYIQLVRRRF